MDALINVMRMRDGESGLYVGAGRGAITVGPRYIV